jgi:hypothetical protein
LFGGTAAGIGPDRVVDGILLARGVNPERFNEGSERETDLARR